MEDREAELGGKSRPPTHEAAAALTPSEAIAADQVEYAAAQVENAAAQLAKAIATDGAEDLKIIAAAAHQEAIDAAARASAVSAAISAAETYRAEARAASERAEAALARQDHAAAIAAHGDTMAAYLKVYDVLRPYSRSLQTA